MYILGNTHIHGYMDPASQQTYHLVAHPAGTFFRRANTPQDFWTCIWWILHMFVDSRLHPITLWPTHLPGKSESRAPGFVDHVSCGLHQRRTPWILDFPKWYWHRMTLLMATTTTNQQLPSPTATSKQTRATRRRHQRRCWIFLSIVAPGIVIVALP